jgi:hypothetical protein
MIICLDASILGTEKHLVYNHSSEQFSWCDDTPAEAWVFGNPNALYAVEDILAYMNEPAPIPFPENQAKAFGHLCDATVKIPWYQVFSPATFRKHVEIFFSSLMEMIGTFEDEAYASIFLAERQFLLGLKKASINSDKFKEYFKREQNATNLKCLKTFSPTGAPAAPPIVYNQNATSTGRLTVKSGPHILTLPKQYRDIIHPQEAEGEIWQIDFISLEPRVLKKISGGDVPHDLYSDIAIQIFDKELSRAQVKLAVLCALYGISEAKLVSMIKSSQQASSIIRKIKDYFQVPVLLKNLRLQLRRDGFIRNFFGRKLSIEKLAANIIISHYIQSTACDVALLGFKQLIEKTITCGLDITPLFVIHDALIVDVPGKYADLLKNLIEEGVTLEGLGNFPLDIEVISSLKA